MFGFLESIGITTLLVNNGFMSVCFGFGNFFNTNSAGYLFFIEQSVFLYGKRNFKRADFMLKLALFYSQSSNYFFNDFFTVWTALSAPPYD
jgi:hypothetical protein